MNNITTESIIVKESRKTEIPFQGARSPGILGAYITIPYLVSPEMMFKLAFEVYQMIALLVCSWEVYHDQVMSMKTREIMHSKAPCKARRTMKWVRFLCKCNEERLLHRRTCREQGTFLGLPSSYPQIWPSCRPPPQFHTHNPLRYSQNIQDFWFELSLKSAQRRWPRA